MRFVSPDIRQLSSHFLREQRGTFTPNYEGTTTAGTTTYTIRAGYYSRVGSMVYISFRLTWTAADGTGNAIITGLPFTAMAGTNYPLSRVFSSITFTGSSIDALVLGNSTWVNLYNAPTSNNGVTFLPIESAGELYFGGVYLI